MTLLALSLAACAGAFDPVGSDSSDGTDTDGSEEPDAEVGGPDADVTVAAAKAFWESDIKPLLDENDCYSCHADGNPSGFPEFGETYAKIKDFKGGVLLCEVNSRAPMRDKGSHLGSAWWDDAGKATITELITLHAATPGACP